MKSEGYRRRWKASFVEERVAAAEVAASFIAERYSSPDDDLTDLVYCRRRDCFTVCRNGATTEIGDVHLNEEIEEFIAANPGRGWVWVKSWDVLHTLKGVCHWWANTETLEPSQFPEEEAVR